MHETQVMEDEAQEKLAEQNVEKKEATMSDLLCSMRSSVEWTKQCISHLSHIERRAMESQFLGREVMRMFIALITHCFPAHLRRLGVGS